MAGIKTNPQFHREKLPFLRKAVIASASITKQRNMIHYFTEIDITIPRKLIYEYKEASDIKLSFTGYIVACLSSTIQKNPTFNSFISGNKIIYPDSITISVLIERRINNISVPEPLALHECEKHDLIEITKEIRNAQNISTNQLGALSGSTWFHFIPKVFLKTFIKIADKNIKMGLKYGKISVTAAGMSSKEPLWVIPHGGTTVLVTIGSIISRIIDVNNENENREHLCLTVSFDHDLIDGAPAARFMNDFIEEIRSGNQIMKIMTKKDE